MLKPRNGINELPSGELTVLIQAADLTLLSYVQMICFSCLLPPTNLQTLESDSSAAVSLATCFLTADLISLGYYSLWSVYWYVHLFFSPLLSPLLLHWPGPFSCPLGAAVPLWQPDFLVSSHLELCKCLAPTSCYCALSGNFVHPTGSLYWRHFLAPLFPLLSFRWPSPRNWNLPAVSQLNSQLLLGAYRNTPFPECSVLLCDSLLPWTQIFVTTAWPQYRSTAKDWHTWFPNSPRL